MLWKLEEWFCTRFSRGGAVLERRGCLSDKKEMFNVRGREFLIVGIIEVRIGISRKFRVYLGIWMGRKG